MEGVKMTVENRNREKETEISLSEHFECCQSFDKLMHRRLTEGLPTYTTSQEDNSTLTLSFQLGNS